MNLVAGGRNHAGRVARCCCLLIAAYLCPLCLSHCCALKRRWNNKSSIAKYTSEDAQDDARFTCFILINRRTWNSRLIPAQNTHQI